MNWRRWFSWCGMALGIGLLTACTSMGISSDTKDKNGGETHRHASFISIDGDKLAEVASLVVDTASNLGSKGIALAVGGPLALFGAHKLGSRSAHKARDQADASYDEALLRAKA